MIGLICERMRSFSHYALETLKKFKCIIVRNIPIKSFKMCKRWGYYSDTYIIFSPVREKLMLVILRVGKKEKKLSMNFPWLTLVYQNKYMVYLVCVCLL